VRKTGAITYFGFAEDTLREDRGHRARQRLRLAAPAYVLYPRHALDEATCEAEKAIETDPGDPHAWGILGDAHLEVGKYAEAGEAYQNMMRLGADLHSWSQLPAPKTLRSRRGEALRATGVPGVSF
jgi:cytochrome c-type biogenesis protein CcmH/NrfG